MQWSISSYHLTWPAQGSPVLALLAGERVVAEARIAEAPEPRFRVDPEAGPVAIQLSASDYALLMDNLRHERSVVLDTRASTLRFAR